MPGRWGCNNVEYFVTLSFLDQLGSDLFFTRLDVHSCDVSTHRWTPYKYDIANTWTSIVLLAPPACCPECRFLFLHNAVIHVKHGVLHGCPWMSVPTPCLTCIRCDCHLCDDRWVPNSEIRRLILHLYKIVVQFAASQLSIISLSSLLYFKIARFPEAE